LAKKRRKKMFGKNKNKIDRNKKMLDLGSGLCCAAGHIAHMYASGGG
jgi:hypothetical protein